MSANVAAGVRSLRQAWWWFAATAILFAAGVVPFAIASFRNRAWLTDVAAHRCYAPPPLPDNRILGWLVVGFVGTALLTLVFGLGFLVIGRHRWWIKVGAVPLVVVFLLIGLWILLTGLLHTEAPGPPGQGVDGSGLPCPGG